VVTGIVASNASSSLASQLRGSISDRDAFHATETRRTAFAVTCDLLTVSALVVGGISLFMTLRRPNAHAVARKGP
jgi:hypothetical protein